MACGPGATPTPESTTPGPGNPASTVYNLETLVDELHSTGAVVEVTDEVWDSKVFEGEVEAQAININSARVTVLKYVGATAAESEASRISPDGYDVRPVVTSTEVGVLHHIDWAGTPHFFKEGRLMVYYIGNEESVLDVLDDVLGPQFAGG